ncbi:hypothetical protein SeLEV6574_g02227 [Synchytrium endobioticum]|nr:hypothetical protein SeLEV6574_g02227 [Synchytrium endobioticum]
MLGLAFDEVPMVDAKDSDEVVSSAVAPSAKPAQTASALLAAIVQQPRFDLVAYRRALHLAEDAIHVDQLTPHLCEKIRIPSKILTDEQVKNDYLTMVENVLVFLNEVFNQALDRQLAPNTESQLLLSVATLLGDDSSRWSTSEIQRLCQELLGLIQGQRTTRQLVAQHLSAILEHHIKPCFAHHPNIDKSELKRIAKPVDAKEQVATAKFYEEQKWKSEHPECPFVFSWCIYQVKQPELKPLQNLVVPTLLTLLDDFDPKYKVLGVELTRHVIIDNTAPSEVRATGLGDLFFNAFITCLSYQSDPDLLEKASLAILDLSSVIEVKGTEALFVRYEQIADVFTRGLLLSVGGKVSVIEIYMATIPLLVERLGIVGVSHLKQLLMPCCEILAAQYIDKPTKILSAKAITSIINTYWPRMDTYCGSVLSAIASSWKYTDPLDDDVKLLLVDLCQALTRSSGPEFKNDLNFLLGIDQELYKPLVFPCLAIHPQP